ncbi:S-adenosyl-L-methionine-dependent methyltransferase [Macrolepiota fuliginosa MF-IS2]|uniref:Cytosine-specific methyltransferase n=1 Tax=Macrolepiota fuliginosa MF-IS2 TaxID=1400762 RepID=A0A9P6CA35_9AGAR|nr:S-adenosyl-L-methionine-dependent methyltransferase [Macrolepiota fuliginosa MF-IS2]
MPGDCYAPEDTLLEGEDDASDTDDVPVRLLHDVCIVEQISGEMVPLAQLLELQLGQAGGYIATGRARPWEEDGEYDEDDDNDEEGSEDGSNDGNISDQSTPTYIRTTRILEFTFYHYDNGEMNQNIYIRTKAAWYILGKPSALYREYYAPLWVQVYILHLVITEALREARITYDEFINKFDQLSSQRNPVVSVEEILGRRLNRDDIEQDNVRAFLASVIWLLVEDCGLEIKRSLLLKYLTSGVSAPAASRPKAPRNDSRDSTTSTAKSRSTAPRQAKATVITPTVGRVAEQLFNNPFLVIGESQEAQGVEEEIQDVKEHNEDPTSIVWGSPAVGNNNYYTSVKIDGVEYEASAGETVMVIPGEDPDRARAQNDKTDAAQSPNEYGNQLWFCQIFYFFEKNGKKLFHGQWLVHGSKTILQEAAHSKSLYLINSCATNPVASIFKKCEVRVLRSDEKEPHDNRDPRSEDYHCGFRWDEEHAAFVNLPTDEEYNIAFQTLPSHQPCFSCGLEAMKAEAHRIRRLRHGFTLHNVAYHYHDFIYIKPSSPDTNLLEIGQIMGVSDDGSDIFKVQIRYLGRYDDYAQDPTKSEEVTFDERQLYVTSRIGEINPERLDGRCYVRHLRSQRDINNWIEHDNHFYVNRKGDPKRGLFRMEESDLEYCHECLGAREDELARAKSLFGQNEPLRGLELFSGAGGLGTGMDLSGYVETKWAVEYSLAAAKTYDRNHPQTKVYCQDSSLLLKHAIETHQGKEPPPLLSNDGKTKCPAMPNKDEVDFIFGGPPCQSFSGANHSKAIDDIRSTMPCNMLSYLEHYNADYLLLENVRGLITYPLLSEQIGRVFVGGIKSGVVKFIMRTLIALGYQVHWKLLQAGQYGAPQNRPRVIFWAAKRGIPLPKHPVPVYAWKQGATRPVLPIGTRMPPPSRSLVPGESHQCAPLKPITVGAAIGDLPKFDWYGINPHRVIAKTKADEQFDLKRLRELNIPCVDAVYHGAGSNELEMYPGYPDGVEYATKPQNRYQKWLRKEMGEGEKVQGHYTKRFSEPVVEATTTVPLEEGADHNDIPKELRPTSANKLGQKHVFYGRLLSDGHFSCTMTTLDPRTKNARPLHPNQRRMVTIRECARAQGFPDHYIFEYANTGSQVYGDVSFTFLAKPSIPDLPRAANSADWQCSSRTSGACNRKRAGGSTHTTMAGRNGETSKRGKSDTLKIICHNIQ